MAEPTEDKIFRFQGLDKKPFDAVEQGETQGLQIATSIQDLTQLQQWRTEFGDPYRVAFHLAIDQYTKSFFPKRVSRWNPFNKDTVIAWGSIEDYGYKQREIQHKIIFSGDPPDEKLKKASIRIEEKDDIPVTLGFGFSDVPFSSVSLKMWLGAQHLYGQIYDLTGTLSYKANKTYDLPGRVESEGELNEYTDLGEFCFQHFNFGRNSNAEVVIGLSDSPFVSARIDHYGGFSNDPPLEVRYEYQESANGLVRRYHSSRLEEKYLDQAPYGLKFTGKVMTLDQYRRLVTSFFRLVPIKTDNPELETDN